MAFRIFGTLDEVQILERSTISYNLHGAFVYRLGLDLLKVKGGVRFPYALPVGKPKQQTHENTNSSIILHRGLITRCGGIGRHMGLKIPGPSTAVPVRFRSPGPPRSRTQQ